MRAFPSSLSVAGLVSHIDFFSSTKPFDLKEACHTQNLLTLNTDDTLVNERIKLGPNPPATKSLNFNEIGRDLIGSVLVSLETNDLAIVSHSHQ